MKKLFAIALVFLLVISLTNSLQSAYADCKEWKVPKDFATIQEAIDDVRVEDGDVIVLYPGEYAGAVVTKAVEIRGGRRGRGRGRDGDSRDGDSRDRDKRGAVINSGPLLTPFQPCGNIVLNIGFKFGFAGDQKGSGATINNLTFKDVAFPVFSRGADDVTVINCKMINPVQGVTNWAGTGWIICGNNVKDLRSANGGGIGVLVGDRTGGAGVTGGKVTCNIVFNNKICGKLHVAPCDGGGYDGTGIVLFADWRFGSLGALGIENNMIFKNKICLKSDNPNVVDVNAIELTEAENLGGIVIKGNRICFNNLKKTESKIVLSPLGLDNPVNKICNNYGNHRGHGLCSTHRKCY